MEREQSQAAAGIRNYTDVVGTALMSDFIRYEDLTARQRLIGFTSARSLSIIQCGIKGECSHSKENQTI